MPTSTVENYLKQILLLSPPGDGLVPMGGIADGLGVVPGTVTTMVKALAEQNLIEHHPRQGVRLTEGGRRIALGMLRKHRLVETFLVTTLRMDWAEVHAEAERLEHAISDRVLERIDALLGHPKADPHGDPIPSAQGRLDTKVYRTLASAPVEQPQRLVRITDQSADFLQFAERHGLLPGTVVDITARAEAAGVVTVRTRPGRTASLGTVQAGSILVEPA